MRREVILALCAASTAMLGCQSGADRRAQRIEAHERRAAVVREAETAQRLATPKDSGRIIYDAPTDLSLANAQRTGAPIAGMEKTQPPNDSTAKP